MLNFPISHAESLIEEISSSQKFNEDIKFTSNGSIKLPPLFEREEPVVIDASGHKITFDSSQVQIGNNQNLEIKADTTPRNIQMTGKEPSWIAMR